MTLLNSSTNPSQSLFSKILLLLFLTLCGCGSTLQAEYCSATLTDHSKEEIYKRLSHALTVIIGELEGGDSISILNCWGQRSLSCSKELKPREKVDFKGMGRIYNISSQQFYGNLHLSLCYQDSGRPLCVEIKDENMTAQRTQRFSHLKVLGKSIVLVFDSGLHLTIASFKAIDQANSFQYMKSLLDTWGAIFQDVTIQLEHCNCVEDEKLLENKSVSIRQCRIVGEGEFIHPRSEKKNDGEEAARSYSLPHSVGGGAMRELPSNIQPHGKERSRSVSFSHVEQEDEEDALKMKRKRYEYPDENHHSVPIQHSRPLQGDGTVSYEGREKSLDRRSRSVSFPGHQAESIQMGTDQ